MNDYKKDYIAILGSSEEILSDLKVFNDYLHSLADGSWLKEYGDLTRGELTYLRYTKGTYPRCLNAQILLLTFKGIIKAELHVKPAITFDPPILAEKFHYKVGYPIRSDDLGPLVYVLHVPLKSSSIPIKLGFPKRYQGGAFVSFNALEYIRTKGKRHRLSP